jgi:hypothetical protein
MVVAESTTAAADASGTSPCAAANRDQPALRKTIQREAHQVLNRLWHLPPRLCEKH